MRPGDRTDDGRGLEWLTADVYDELRARARAMSRGAPPTLAGTAGINTALERILRHRTRFRDQRHFTAYCLFLLRRLWISHRRDGARRARREAAALLPTLTLLAGEPVVPSGEDAVAVLELLERLRGDRHIARRRRIARAVEYHLVAGFTQAETADLLGESKAMVQQRLAFFLAWARLAVAPELVAVERAIAAAAADPRLARGPALAEAARRHYLLGEPRGAIAAALNVAPVARGPGSPHLRGVGGRARGEERGGAPAVTAIGADLVVEVALKHAPSERPRIVAELCGGDRGARAALARAARALRAAGGAAAQRALPPGARAVHARARARGGRPRQGLPRAAPPPRRLRRGEAHATRAGDDRVRRAGPARGGAGPADPERARRAGVRRGADRRRARSTSRWRCAPIRTRRAPGRSGSAARCTTSARASPPRRPPASSRTSRARCRPRTGPAWCTATSSPRTSS